MHFQLREIILWPRNANFRPRRVLFEIGKVNVISGASRTGKSAVIPIVDYCLGSGSCSIPVNTIRKSCAWFGVIISTEQGDKLIARREPGAQRSTDDCFLLEAARITEVPAAVSKNTTTDSIKRMFDELAGLSKLSFSSDDDASGFDGRPSFRDLAAFTFQPQNVVANPDVLFFKTNTYEHREKLRKIFPYVLGAITPALMAKQFELNRLRVELRRKERELKNAQEVSAAWLAELRARVSEAQELGLVARPDKTLDREQMIGLLEEVVARTDLRLEVSGATITEAVRELRDLDKEEREVSRELTTLRYRLSEMDRMTSGNAQYESAIAQQRGRLQLSKWLSDQAESQADCPMCGTVSESAAERLRVLGRRLKEVENESGVDKEIPAAFDREMQRVRADVSQGSERLRAVQVRRRSLAARSKEARDLQFATQRAERFVGNLESALALHRRIGGDSALVDEVARLRERVAALESELREQDIESRKRRALTAVNANAARLLPSLDVEHPDHPISLEINDLTIKVVGGERDDLLSEIGSGSNWLSYHLAALLALHQFFLSQQHSPIPAFMILDQPSQLYFPKRLVAPRGEEASPDPTWRDEDVDAVRKAFQVLGRVVLEARGRLQLIVLDHAGTDVWGGVPGVVGLPEWRNGVKLVPLEWLE
ncbi:MAG: DUF3732 domain-containing protein [Deltaproteobacteria bacterium]|nr:DUF3732 domain-containing protein [Deltaproteobacteria bacterium]